MCSEDYSTWFVCACVCVSKLILVLQATKNYKWLQNDASQKSKTAIFLKRLRLRDMP